MFYQLTRKEGDVKEEGAEDLKVNGVEHEAEKEKKDEAKQTDEASKSDESDKSEPAKDEKKEENAK